VRLNFSHDLAEVHRQRAEFVRDRAQAHGRQIGVIADMQGPKIRIGRFKGKRVRLEEGQRFVIDAELPLDAGDETRVGLTYKALPNDVARGATLLLDDGRIVLWVDEVSGAEIVCRVVVGGELSDNKGVNRQGGGLSAHALTDKDREDIKSAAQIQADYVAISFPRNAKDIEEARTLLRAAGGTGGIVAKIERAEAVEAIEEIIRVSDAIMLARGDLGVEIGDAALPPVQKRIIRLARKMNRVVITATQMMESMIENAIPTRAEVSDVANAVLDGTDAVMLSAETPPASTRWRRSRPWTGFAARPRRRTRRYFHAPHVQSFRACRRGHCDGGDVQRQPSSGARHSVPDGIGIHAALDVAYQLGGTDLCLDAACGNP